MSNIIKKIELIIYIFCFLFAPPFIKNLNFLFVVFAYALIMIIFKYKSQLKMMLNKKEVKNIILVLALYFGIYFLSICINCLKDRYAYVSNYFINIYSLILAFPMTIVCSLYVIFRCDELNVNFEGLLKMFIIAGMLQVFIALLTLVFPSVKELTVSMMLKATGDNLLNTPWITQRRFFGFANSMLDLFGFGTGILATLPLFYVSKTKNKKYYILSPILLIVPILNARSGIVIFAIGVLTYFIYLGLKREIKFGLYFKYIMIIAILVVSGLYMVNKWSPDTINWITKDFESFVSLEDENGTADVLFSKKFWQLPSPLEIIIGTGHNVSGYSDYATEDINHSDVGYINELWKSGIIGTFLLYYLTYYIISTATKNTENNRYKAMFVFFGIACLIFSIKATIFTYNPGGVIIYTFALMMIYNKKEMNISDK